MKKKHACMLEKIADVAKGILEVRGDGNYFGIVAASTRRNFSFMETVLVTRPLRKTAPVEVATSTRRKNSFASVARGLLIAVL